MQSNQCVSCKYYLGEGECGAFPNGIPSDIFTGLFDHTKEYEGDKGIRFQKYIKRSFEVEGTSGEFDAIWDMTPRERTIALTKDK